MNWLGILQKLRASMSWGTKRFLWRIDNVKARMAKAEILYSDEFYSRQYGYKLKARVDFNGCGDGKGTHMSVFFKLVPGEYDGLLEWPFPHSVTFTLYDQSTYPDQGSNVTQKIPVGEMSLEKRLRTLPEFLGYSTFVSHKTLTADRHFIKDDVMFLKISFNP